MKRNITLTPLSVTGNLYEVMQTLNYATCDPPFD